MPSQSITEPNLERALDICRDRIGRRESHLVAVATQLDSPLRRNLFTACYAAMRVLDDVVDDDFVIARDRSLEAVEAYIDQWRQQTEDAAAGSFTIAEESIEPEIFYALNAFLGQSEIGVMPWHHLADAMRADVARSGVEDWGTFEAYCRGASVAPAQVFLYILSCRIDGERATATALPRPTLYYARDLALFCYLVHILRDLAKDARRDANLVIVPRTQLDEFGLAGGGLIAAIEARDSTALRPLVTALIERASQHRSRGEKLVHEISIELSENANAALANLVSRYVETFEMLAADYDAHLNTTNWGLGSNPNVAD